MGTAIIGYKTDRKLIEINGGFHYPMQSVYKFPLALAIMNMVDKGLLCLDEYLRA